MFVMPPKKIFVLLLLVISLPFLLYICFVLVWWFLPLLPVPPPLPPSEETLPNWSPDGRKITYVCYVEGPTEGQSRIDLLEPDGTAGVPWSQYTRDAADICVADVNDHSFQRLTQEPGGDWYPIWSPDGTQIAYLRQDGIYIIDMEEYKRRHLVTLPNEYEDRLAWSPDGSQLLFSACLDNPDRDVYLVDVASGIINNLTGDSRKHEVNPYWTLNGNKIFFLSTSSTSSECAIKQDAPYQMKIINTDGRDEQMIYKELYYPFVTVLMDGQIIFVSDLASKNRQGYDWSHNIVYKMDIHNLEPVEVPLLNSQIPFHYLMIDSVSPNGKHLAYKDDDQRKKVGLWDVESGEVIGPLNSALLFDNEFSSLTSVADWTQDGKLTAWSPQSRQIAFTGYENKGGIYGYDERHIYIFDLQDGTLRPLIQQE